MVLLVFWYVCPDHIQDKYFPHGKEEQCCDNKNIVGDKVPPSIYISIYKLDMGEHYWTQMIFEEGIFVAKMPVCINACGVERGFKCSCS